MTAIERMDWRSPKQSVAPGLCGHHGCYVVAAIPGRSADRWLHRAAPVNTGARHRHLLQRSIISKRDASAAPAVRGHHRRGARARHSCGVRRAPSAGSGAGRSPRVISGFLATILRESSCRGTQSANLMDSWTDARSSRLGKSPTTIQRPTIADRASSSVSGAPRRGEGVASFVTGLLETTTNRLSRMTTCIGRPERPRSA